MSPKHLSVAGLVIGAAAILAGCAAATPAETPPALIKPVAGSQIPQLQLTERAVQRLGIVTQPVRPRRQRRVSRHTRSSLIRPWSMTPTARPGPT